MKGILRANKWIGNSASTRQGVTICIIWCCIDRLTWQALSECGPTAGLSTNSHTASPLRERTLEIFEE